MFFKTHFQGSLPRSHSEYRRYLPRKVFLAGEMMVLIQGIGFLTIAINHACGSFVLPISAFGMSFCSLFVGFRDVGDVIFDEWRLRIYWWTSLLLSAQIIVYFCQFSFIKGWN
jgi:hypothetical protein